MDNVEHEGLLHSGTVDITLSDVACGGGEGLGWRVGDFFLCTLHCSIRNFFPWEIQVAFPRENLAVRVSHHPSFKVIPTVSGISTKYLPGQVFPTPWNV